MGSIPAELSLDLMPGFVPKSISDFLKEISPIGNVSERKEKVGDYVKRLEDEMKKVDAFRRELPLCMLLLKDAIQFLKDQSNLCSEPNVQPVLEEFIPLKKDLDGDTEINQEKSCTKDKMNWMSSVQLWKSDVQIKQRNVEENHPASEDLSQSSKTRTEGATFFPFKGQSSCPVTAVAEEDKEGYSPVSVLSLLTPGTKTPREESGSSGLSSKPNSTRAVSSNLQVVPQLVRPRQQESRKQRRCWSPELHQRFINSLKQLGGSQVATPKQIRELMQVDGLTNDEVKSHLQKYRLHNRRMSTIASSIPSNRPVVVFGGLWISQNQYANSSKASSSQSDSPQSPLQLTGNTGGTSADSMGDEEDELHSQQTWKG